MEEILEVIREMETDPLANAAKAFDAACEQMRLAQAYLKLDRILRAKG